jgi:hypothetical protein
VLEANGGVDGDEIRDLGRRIRGNAQLVARMVQLLATATGLASRPLRASSTDLLVLAKSVITDANGRGDVRRSRQTETSVVHIDAELVGFAWRAYIAVESDTRGRPVDETELHLIQAEDDVLIEMRVGLDDPAARALASSEARVELPAFLRHNGGPARLETSMGLNLAQDLVTSHGGDMELWGRPGARSGLCLRFHKAA